MAEKERKRMLLFFNGAETTKKTQRANPLNERKKDAIGKGKLWKIFPC